MVAEAIEELVAGDTVVFGMLTGEQRSLRTEGHAGGSGEGGDAQPA